MLTTLIQQVLLKSQNSSAEFLSKSWHTSFLVLLLSNESAEKQQFITRCSEGERQEINCGRGRISSAQRRFKGAYEATLVQEVVMLKEACSECAHSDREVGVRTFQRSLLWLLPSLLCLYSARWLSIISTLNRQHLFWNFATPLWESLLFCECTVDQVCGFELRLHSATPFCAFWYSDSFCVFYSIVVWCHQSPVAPNIRKTFVMQHLKATPAPFTCTASLLTLIVAKV